MTKGRIMILITMSLVFLMTLYFVLFNKKEKNILSKIPGNYTSVAIIDIKSVLPKLLFENLGSENKGMLKKFIPDSLNLDWNALGIGLPEKIAFFTMEDSLTGKISVYFVSTISKVSKFNRFMDSLCFKTGSTIELENNMRFLEIKKWNVALGWNREYLTGNLVTSGNNRDLLRSILTLERQQSVLNDSGFVSRLKSNYDIMAYSRPYRHVPYKYMEYINQDMEGLISYVQFNKGQLKVDVQIIATEGSNLYKLFSGSSDSVHVVRSTNNTVFQLIANINPEAFYSLYKRYKFVDIKENTAPTFAAWDGRISLVYNGNRSVTREFVSYDYDDNFNKIEVRRSVQEDLSDVQAVFGLTDSLFKQPGKQSSFYKEGYDTLLFKGGDYVIKKEKGCYLTYNKLLSKPASQKIKPAYKALATVDFKRLLPVLHEKGLVNNANLLRLNLYNLEIKLFEDALLSAEFNFSDSRNSLLSILDALN